MKHLDMTKPLVEALTQAGLDPESVERVEPAVVLAMYLDALAKEYGLSESLDIDIDVDPIERLQQPEKVMAIVRHYLAGGGSGLDADSIRSQLYAVFGSIAADPTARKTLNQNRPLTETEVLLLAQIYWNLEGNDARPKLPIRRTPDRDIPVAGFSTDYATMPWTKRVNQKGPQRSSGQGFRTQGARLVVLAAQHIVGASDPIASTTTDVLEIRRTSDPEAPLELALKDLSHRATSEGRHQEAFDLATLYLKAIQRRAVAAPYESEHDLATARLLKGTKGLMLHINRRDDNGPVDLADLESATASLEMLVELEPENMEHLVGLIGSYCTLAQAQKHAGRTEEAAESIRQARALAERIGPDLERKLAELVVYVASSSLGGVESTEQALRAAEMLEDISNGNWTTELSESGVLPGLNDLRGVIGMALFDAGLHERGIALMSDAVDVAEASDAPLADREREIFGLLAPLAMACSSTERHEAAVDALKRVLELADSEGFRQYAWMRGSSLAYLVLFYFDQLDHLTQVRATDTLESMLDTPESVPDSDLARVLLAILTTLMRLVDKNLIRYGWDHPPELDELEPTEAHEFIRERYEAEKYVREAGNRDEALAWTRRLIVVATRMASSGIRTKVEEQTGQETFNMIQDALTRLSDRLAEFADDEALLTAQQLRSIFS